MGEVLDTSALFLIERDPGGDVRVGGTVTTRHNGPYRLEARLSELFVEQKGRRTIVNDVYAETPGGPVLLGTVDWVTVVTGPGATSVINPVRYRVVWGMGASKNPDGALHLPLAYRVVPLVGAS